MSFIPPDFGGFVSVWDPNPRNTHALVVRYGKGKPIEGMRLTPLNLLQLRGQLDALIAQGDMSGYIKQEHYEQMERLPVVVTSPEDAAKDIPKRDDVNKITGEE